MLEHGGRLGAAAARYRIPAQDWLDLSTGINPQGWPVPPLPRALWTRLPEDDDGLAECACHYYGARHILPVAGSQAAIQALPWLRGKSQVGIVAPGYGEHARAWQRAGHTIDAIAPDDLEPAVPALDVLVVMQPNNPTGHVWRPDTLLAWHTALARRGGWLVVDEAFVDATPGWSVAPYGDRRGLIVLRSLGKFFGLGGARVGFAIAEEPLLARLAEALGPWSVAGPSRHLAMLALRDEDWQIQARTRLPATARRLAVLLARHGLAPEGGCALFQWLRHRHARAIHEGLAGAGILTRRFDDPASLRFGLPGAEADWPRLDAQLGRVMASLPARP